MAEPGDSPPSDKPRPQDHAHDDLIGFTSAASLAGAPRQAPAPAPLAPSTAFDDDLEQGGLFDAPTNRVAALRAAQQPARTPPAPAVRADGSIPAIPPPTNSAPTNPAPTNPANAFGRAATVKPALIESAEGGMGLFTVYALILFAVPTLGVAAAVALIAVAVRPRPSQILARGHFDFQKRTLSIAAVAAVVAVLLIPVSSFVGVFALFVVALWLLARGAWGLMLLAKGRAIAHPRQWLIAAR